MVPTLIFSVPLVHLASALLGKAEPTAFATDVIELFSDGSGEQLIPEGTPVLIHASQPHTDPENGALFSAGAFVAAGSFRRWTAANNLGRHPKPELRPVTTDSDGPVCGFIEVSGLHQLGTPVAIAAARKADGKAFKAHYVPRRPILARTAAI